MDATATGFDVLTRRRAIAQSLDMRRVAIILCAALVVALPTVSHAQYNDNDQQNPKEYHDEDSQPLALFADILYPVGFGLEWLIARPLHYIANDSPIAPVYRPVGGNDTSPPPPVPIIPDNTMDQGSSSSSTPQDWSPTRAPIITNSTTITQQAPSPAAPPLAAPPFPSSQPANSQPAFH
jgi:hypothetical protein